MSSILKIKPKGYDARWNGGQKLSGDGIHLPSRERCYVVEEIFFDGERKAFFVKGQRKKMLNDLRKTGRSIYWDFNEPLTPQTAEKMVEEINSRYTISSRGK